MLTFEKNTHFARLVWVIVACVFIADLLIPRYYDIVFVYLLAHFLAVFFREKSDVMLLAVVTSALSIVVLVIKPQDAPLEQMLLERAPAIVSFWAAAFFVIKFMLLREEEELEKLFCQIKETESLNEWNVKIEAFKKRLLSWNESVFF